MSQRNDIMLLNDALSRTTPRWSAPAVLFAAATLFVATVIVLAGVASRTGVGASRLDAPTGGKMIELTFSDIAGGGIAAETVSAGKQVFTIPRGQDGFIRTALRTLAQERQAAGKSSATPFQLGRTDAGRQWLRDPVSGRLLYLDAYGAQNAQQFQMLFDHFMRSKQ